MTSPTHSPAAQPHAPAKAGAACPSRAAPATIPDDILEDARKVLSDIDGELTMGRLYVVARAIQLAEQRATERAEADNLSGEAISIARDYIKRAIGIEVAFFDDLAKLTAILASRAVLAGLHSDADSATRERMDAAAETLREVHERELGFPIPAIRSKQEGEGA